MPENLLFEIGCEELPALPLINLVKNMEASLRQELHQFELTFESIHSFSTPRRIAFLIKDLIGTQPPRSIERQGPSIDAAYDKSGTPTLACMGFVKSCGVSIDQLEVRETKKGAWVYCLVNQQGKNTRDLIAEIIQNTLKNTPLNKSMRWGNSDVEFLRPVQWITLLLGNEVIPANILGKKSDRLTYGHRFHHPESIRLENANEYRERLRLNKVIADFNERRELIRSTIQSLDFPQGVALIDENLLDEVTNLVEWPVVHMGHFDRRFLEIPSEVLITSMKVHQKCFPVQNQTGSLQPYFILVSNIESKKPSIIVSGNERVINARLNDAEFFYQNDLKKPLESHLEELDKLIFQKELGSIGKKVQRVSKLASYIAKELGVEYKAAARAALLSKCDLLTQMVKEFPELQGTMGYYYALHDKESLECANAIKEHYQPRFSGDLVAPSSMGSIIAIADKIDTLVGTLGINKKPTGDKDPFALRRAAQGVLRTLIEKEISLDLVELLAYSVKTYQVNLPNTEVVEQSFEFIMERLKAWYLDQGISHEIFESVRSKNITELLDFYKRVKAVQEFLLLPEAASLSSANKRVNNILKKQGAIKIKDEPNPDLFENSAENDLNK